MLSTFKTSILEIQDTIYEDSLIAKTFMFQFVNSYSALFYICFVKPFFQDTDPCIGNCMSELQSTLGTIFLARIAINTILQVSYSR